MKYLIKNNLFFIQVFLKFKGWIVGSEPDNDRF